MKFEKRWPPVPAGILIGISMLLAFVIAGRGNSRMRALRLPVSPGMGSGPNEPRPCCNPRCFRHGRRRSCRLRNHGTR